MSKLDTYKLQSEYMDHAHKSSDFLIIIAGICGLAIHLSILTLFFVLELWTLLQLNIISCIVWALIIYLGTQGRTSLAIHIGTVEAVAHALATTLELGQEFGFHYYLLPISILIALNPSLNFRFSALIASSTILLFTCLNTVPRSESSLQLEPATLMIINSGNIMISGFAMILTGMVVKKLFSQQKTVLKNLAQTDELTQVFNRRYALKFLDEAEANRRRNHLPYSICICDLDKFKEVNDTFGHCVGDEILEKFARFLQSSVRETDCVARWGGEEFLIVLTHTDGSAAESTMNKMLGKLRTLDKIVINGDRLLSASIGIAEARGNSAVDDTIVVADNALYKAKEDGRDRAVYFAQ